jgi:hypothetical protein
LIVKFPFDAQLAVTGDTRTQLIQTVFFFFSFSSLFFLLLFPFPPQKIFISISSFVFPVTLISLSMSRPVTREDGGKEWKEFIRLMEMQSPPAADREVSSAAVVSETDDSDGLSQLCIFGWSGYGVSGFLPDFVHREPVRIQDIPADRIIQIACG